MNPVGDLHDEEEFHDKPVNKKIIGMRSLLKISQVPVNCNARSYFFSNHKQFNFYIISNEGGYACLRPLSPPASGAPL